MWVFGGRKSLSRLLQRAGERSDPKGRNKVSKGQSSHRKYICYLHLNGLQSYVQLGRVHSATYCMLLCAYVSLCSGVALLSITSLYAAVAAAACLGMCYAVIHEGIAFEYKHTYLWMIRWIILLLLFVTGSFLSCPLKIQLRVKESWQLQAAAAE